MSRFLLVFDLDGTLVDSAPDLHAALNQMLRERGRPALPLPQVKRMIGDGVPALVARALAASGADPADAAGALPRFLELYEANATRLSRPYPKVLETLTSLRQRGYRTSICTNKPQRATIAVVEGLGLGELFDGIAGGDRFPVRKPDPGHLLGLIGELDGRDRSECNDRRQRERRRGRPRRRGAACADALRLCPSRPRFARRRRSPRPFLRTPPSARPARAHALKIRWLRASCSDPLRAA